MADHFVSYQTLLQQCAKGDPAALQQLYDLEAPYLNALGLTLLHRHNDAEELVRESFGLIWRHASAYDLTLGSARAWIYSIFRFRAQLRLKQTPNLSPFVKVKSRLVIPSDAPNALQQFQRLDEKARKMLVLAYLHAYSYAEIAKECHSSIDLTQKHINQALITLTRLFDGWQSQSDEELALLGTYCLGLLRDSTHTAPAQNLLNDNRKAAQDLLKWEDILSALTYSLAPQSPSPQLLTRLYQDLKLDPSTVVKPISTSVSAPAQTMPNKALSASLSEIINNPSANAPSRFDTPVTIGEPTQNHNQLNTTAPTPSVSSSFTSDPSAPDLTVNDRLNAKAQKEEVIQKDSSTLLYSDNNDASLFDSKKSTANKSKWKKPYWVLAALLILMVSLTVWAFMPKAPIIQMVKMTPRTGAVLQAPGQSSTPAWILSVDPKGHVLLTPQVRTELQVDEVVQLWTQAPNSTEIRSLGLLNPNEPVTIPQELIGEVVIGQIFEMTLEPLTGSNAPSGPVLFIGRIVKFGDFNEEVKESEI